jgi:hypothetical protein
MRPTSTLLALLALATPCMAQNLAAGAPDLVNTHRVDSPNRSSAAAMASSRKQAVLEADKERTALRLVDRQGRVAGRLEGSDQLLMRYHNELVTIALGPFSARLPLTTGGLGWAGGASIFYQSADCSGQGFLAPRIVGTNFIGIGVVEDGKNFVLVGDVRQSVMIGFGSVFGPAHGQCAQPSQPETIIGVPIEASVPVDAIATPPLLVQ